MIRVDGAIQLPPRAASQLKRWQQELDEVEPYPERVSEAKRLFRQRNGRTGTFGQVRTTLEQMCGGIVRCMFCGDSLADEVEHYRPKDLFPGDCFVWANYLYACGPCNGGFKRDRFAVFDATGSLVHLDQTRAAEIGRGLPASPPIAGDPVLLNPRTDDPMQFILLDIQDSFRFLPDPDCDQRSLQRARYTISLLGLNSRDVLIQARRAAFGTFLSRLVRYVGERDASGDSGLSDRHGEELRQCPQPAVWQEMKRQRGAHPRLAELFQIAPEALTW
ncbi:MAG: aminoglycoside phosphotransferase [Planctomycetota bacterium]